MFIKLNEIHGTANLINLNKVERITSNGCGGSTIWFSQDDIDTMVVHESFEEVELMIHFGGKVDFVVGRENLQEFKDMPAHSVF